MKSLRMFRREFVAIPLLLVGVALNQMRLSRSDFLSPWKGGGFGMFSSVDSPGERIVQCIAWDKHGQGARIDIGNTPAFEDALRRLKCAPNQRVMDWLANAVLRAKFVPVRLLRERTVAELQAFNPETDLDLVLLTPNREILRPRTAEDGELDPKLITELDRVEIVLRSPNWDSDLGTVSFEPLLSARISRSTGQDLRDPRVAAKLESEL